MDRRDWREGRIASTSAGTPIRASKPSLGGDVILAIVFNGLTWPAAYFLWSRIITEGGRTSLREFILRSPPDILLLLIFLLFPMCSVVLAFRAVWGMIDRVRYGRTTLALNAVPAPIGGQLSGSIGAEGLTLRGGEDVLLRLECRATETRKSHDETSISTRVEWSTERVLSRNEISQPGGAARIPVQLPIPLSSHETGERVELPGGDFITFSWWLVARVQPHHGWNAEFEIPVLQTAPVSAVPEPQPSERAAIAGQTPPPVRPPSSRIVVHSAQTDGIVIEYHGQSRWITVVALIWLYTLPVYVIPLAYYEQSRVGAALGWLMVALVINGGFAYMLLRGWPRRLMIGPEWITVDSGLGLVGRRRRIRTSEAGKVTADPVAIARKGQTNVFKSWFFVAPRRLSDAESRWLVFEIERALARYR
jgi:hypothetical protein